VMKKESPEQVPGPYSVHEYLSFERASADVKHEYIDGLIVAMSGASRAHNLITGNIVQRVVNQLAATPCLRS
jgi:Uma2 family endonuclease